MTAELLRAENARLLQAISALSSDAPLLGAGGRVGGGGAESPLGVDFNFEVLLPGPSASLASMVPQLGPDRPWESVPTTEPTEIPLFSNPRHEPEVFAPPQLKEI